MFNKIKEKLSSLINNKLNYFITDKIYTKTYCNKSVEQSILKFYYQEYAKQKKKLDFNEVGFNLFSSTNEDGILLYIFSVIGFTNKKCIDLGCGYIKGNNTANLIINHGFNALLIDANEKNIRDLESFFRTLPFNIISFPKFECSYITKENINDLILKNDMQGEIDFLTIDLDGIDYWVLKSIETVKARVILVEYQDALGPDKSLTVPYSPDFDFHKFKVNQMDFNYMGASLNAFVKLLKQRGYKLIGCNTGGWNAFFLLEGLVDDFFPEIEPSKCFIYDRNCYSIKERYPLIKDMPWVEV